MSDWYGYLCDDARTEPDDAQYHRVQPRARIFLATLAAAHELHTANDIQRAANIIRSNQR